MDTTAAQDTYDDAIEKIRVALRPGEIIAALRDLGLDAKDLAKGTGADERSVRRWLEGQAPNRSYEAALGNLRVVVVYILQRRALLPDRVAQWLRMPSVELQFAPPLSAIADGRVGEVVAAADAFIAPPPRNAPAAAADRAVEQVHAEHGEETAGEHVLATGGR